MLPSHLVMLGVPKGLVFFYILERPLVMLGLP